MDEPRADIYGGDYNIYGEQGYGIAFYEGGDSLEEDILGFNFSRAVFYCNDAGELSGIRFYSYDLSQKLGDYPVIGPGEALELLCGGRYITSSPYEFPGRDSVRRAELIYRTSEWDENYMPYYRFYAELPDTGNAEAERWGSGATRPTTSRPSRRNTWTPCRCGRAASTDTRRVRSVHIMSRGIPRVFSGG